MTTSALNQILSLKPSAPKALPCGTKINIGNKHRFMNRVKDIIGEDLYPAFSGLVLYSFKDRMELGVKGLPNTSKKLVKMGVFTINESETHLLMHSEIEKVIKQLESIDEEGMKALESASKKHK